MGKMEAAEQTGSLTPCENLQGRTATTVRELSTDLQIAWIERLFSRLAAFYGAAFGRQWENANLSEVKFVWAEKLGGFTAYEIGAALKACESKQYPPNLPEFIELCRNAARRTYVASALPSPKISAEDIEARMQKAAEAVERKPEYDYRGWCKDLKRRYLAGEHLLPIQILMASEAMNETWEKGQCTTRVAA